jgi:DNA-binding MarR family transcriptional regulator
MPDHHRRARAGISAPSRSCSSSCAATTHCSTCASSPPRPAAGSVNLFVVFAVMFSLFLVLVQYLQAVLGYSALRQRQGCCRWRSMMMPLSTIAPTIAERIGFRRTLVTGMLLIAISAWFTFAMLADPDWWATCPSSPASGPRRRRRTRHEPVHRRDHLLAPEEKQGVASALNDTVREMGGAVGIALIGSVLNSAYRANITPVTATAALPPRRRRAGPASPTRASAALCSAAVHHLRHPQPSCGHPRHPRPDQSGHATHDANQPNATTQRLVAGRSREAAPAVAGHSHRRRPCNRRRASLSPACARAHSAPDPPQLNMGQIDSLDLLVTRREWTMCDFAAALGVDPSTATRAVDRLVDIGLAKREHSITDKRVTLVHVTQTGRDTQRRVARRRLSVVADALESFTDTERQTLVDLLDRLVATLEVTVAARAEATPRLRAAQDDAEPTETAGRGDAS